ncbi:DNA repair protein RecO [uncultured Legionella sp.]|uniref:DNA repair protein RecO n=1 Tax=uncultured Legionella sp. TaxID=210934 RepID=UPI00261EF883|nr:DNA repair protein RecO C-terminal domain-containing protein [uncultured Legionella sp.]
MTTKSLQAWVIHKQWSGDTSARVDFFSRELGLVHCLCKGGRTPKKQSLLQAFTPLWVCVDERHDRYYAKSIESISPMLHLEGNSLFSGLYINELLYHSLRPIYPDIELFNAYLITLNGLASTSNRLEIESVLRRFEWALLKACGHSFSWTVDARTGLIVSSGTYYQFVAGEGFVSSNKGIPGEYILALAEDNLNEVPYLKSAKIIMRQAIDHLLGGRTIKARALYIQ